MAELGLVGRVLTTLPSIRLVHSSQPHAKLSDRPKRRRRDGCPDNSCTVLGRQDTSGRQVWFCGMLPPVEASHGSRSLWGSSRPLKSTTPLHTEALVFLLYTLTIDLVTMGVLEGSGSHFGVCLSSSFLLIASRLDERLWFQAH